ncbi:hypothetical protein RHMOL_Rhmol02G0186400 [Rhododendron molle]|uniref:Uncharacterized protein n=1 Tax=Rhododendron molle TaxID=49168 RepID=A0ACC0PUF0_RHOML|nr:hypothetical protein RHMOL_Rhmol02G0186400 [Rhododendron molle]
MLPSLSLISSNSISLTSLPHSITFTHIIPLSHHSPLLSRYYSTSYLFHLIRQRERECAEQ